jgi:hypothetical protein
MHDIKRRLFYSLVCQEFFQEESEDLSLPFSGI